MIDRLEVPSECNVTLVHALRHLKLSIEEWESNHDLDQALHEIDMCYRILNNMLCDEFIQPEETSDGK